jgi:hypothetical protein
MSNRPYGDWNPQLKKNFPTKKEIEEKFPTTMKNEIYSKIIENYFLCTSTFLA